MTKTLKNNLTALQRFVLHFSESHYVDVLYFFAIFFLKLLFKYHFNTWVVFSADIVVQGCEGELWIKHVRINAANHVVESARKILGTKPWPGIWGNFHSINIDECC